MQVNPCSVSSLGFYLGFFCLFLSIPEDKIYISFAGCLSGRFLVPVKLLYECLHRLPSELFPVCFFKIMTKALHSVIDSRAYWSARVFLTTETISKFNFCTVNA